MRIERAEICSFGNLNQVELGPFTRNLIIIHGRAEGGKSLVSAFFRTMLFGPAAGGNGAATSLCGRLIVRDDEDRRYVIERCRDSGERIIGPDGAATSDTPFDALLPGGSPEFYRRVFVFGPDDLDVPDVRPEPTAGWREMIGAGSDAVPDGAARRVSEVCHELCLRREALLLDLQAVEAQLTAIDRLEVMNEIETPPDVSSSTLQESWESPDELRRMIDELRESWTRLQAVRRMRDLYQRTTAPRRIPHGRWFLACLTIGVILPVMIGTATRQAVILSLGIVSAVLGMVMLLLASAARARFDSAQLQARLHLEMTHREAQVRFLQSAMNARVDPNHIDEEIERLEQTYARLASPNSATMSEGMPGKSEHEAILSPSEVRAIALERRQELLRRVMHLSEQIEELERDRLRALLRRHRQELLGALDEQVRAWFGRLSIHAISRGAANAGNGRRLEILRGASDAFDARTLGAYPPLLTVADERGGVAIGRDGQEIGVADLGPGRRELAQLALRLGVIRTFEGQRPSPPLLVDDFLASCESDLAAEAIRALSRLASDHQIFFFTANASTVAVARTAAPGASVVALADREAPDPAAVRLEND